MKRREVLVIKLSGSIFFASQFGRVVNAIASSAGGGSIVLVAGGGIVARRYIHAGRELGADQSSLDEIGISISRLNASVLKQALGTRAFSSLPRNLSEVVDALDIGMRTKTQRIVVCGGFHPGQSTNAVAALVAEKTSAARLINATDVDGVYDRDPRKFKNAKRLRTVSVRELGKLLDSESIQAGDYDLMDPVALKIISRSKIPTWVVKCDAKALSSAIAGKILHGTRVSV